MKSKNSVWRQSALVFTTLAGAFGCAVDAIEQPDSSLELGSSEAEIINGTVVGRGTLGGLGVVALVRPGSTSVNSTSQFCTGTLLTNQHVLTARHCIRPTTFSGSNVWGTALTPTSVIHEGPTAGDDQVRSATVILEGSDPVGGQRTMPDEDLAVLQLDTPMVFGTMDGYFREIDTRTSLPAGTVAFCAGYGFGNWASAGTGGSWIPAGGGGTLRSASLYSIAPPAGTSANAYLLGVNSSGQTLLDGDSGSTCFIDNRIQGIASRAYLRTRVDFDQNGSLTDVETIGASGAYYYAPWGFRARVLAAITTNVSLQYRMVPSTTPGASVNYFTTASAITLTMPATGENRTVGSGLTAIRSGRVEVTVVEPPNTLCERISRAAPLSGGMAIQGTCLNEGLFPAIFM